MFFKNLTPKKIDIVLKRPSCFTKRLFLVIKTKKQTQNGQKSGKKLPKSDKQMYNFIKQNYIEVERGVEYMKCQKEVAILSDF